MHFSFSLFVPQQGASNAEKFDYVSMELCFQSLSGNGQDYHLISYLTVVYTK